MSNREIYRDAWENCCAPKALKEKLKNPDEMKTRNISYWKVASVAVLAIGILLAGSNGVCYAATGTTWVDKVVFMASGKKDVNFHEVGDMVYSDFVDQNGKNYYRGDGENDQAVIDAIAENGETLTLEGVSYRNSMSQDAQNALDGNSIFSDLRDMEDIEENMDQTSVRVIPYGLKEEEDHIYYIVGNEVKIDVTKELKKGNVYEEYTFEGIQYKVKIEGSFDSYVMHASLLEE